MQRLVPLSYLIVNLPRFLAPLVPGCFRILHKIFPRVGGGFRFDEPVTSHETFLSGMGEFFQSHHNIDLRDDRLFPVVLRWAFFVHSFRGVEGV
jgi:hypothetical protein